MRVAKKKLGLAHPNVEGLRDPPPATPGTARFLSPRGKESRSAALYAFCKKILEPRPSHRRGLRDPATRHPLISHIVVLFESIDSCAPDAAAGAGATALLLAPEPEEALPLGPGGGP